MLWSCVYMGGMAHHKHIQTNKQTHMTYIFSLFSFAPLFFVISAALYLVFNVNIQLFTYAFLHIWRKCVESALFDVHKRAQIKWWNKKRKNRNVENTVYRYILTYNHPLCYLISTLYLLKCICVCLVF